MRICSFLPSATEIVYALELHDQLYGVTFECDYPADARHKPKVVRSLFEHITPPPSSGEISVDPLEQNMGFAEQQHADFPLLSDPTKATATDYGVLNQGGVANRWTFYIGKDGRIAAIDKTINPETSAEDIAAKLGALNILARH